MPILSQDRGQSRELTGPGRPALLEATLRERQAMEAVGAGAPAGRAGRRTARTRSALFETCANPGCGSGWLHLWRSRQAPVFEGGWNCSAACTAARVSRGGAPRTGRQGARLPRVIRIAFRWAW
jgi:hypothetical protein